MNSNSLLPRSYPKSSICKDLGINNLIVVNLHKIDRKVNCFLLKSVDFYFFVCYNSHKGKTLIFHFFFPPKDVFSFVFCRSSPARGGYGQSQFNTIGRQSQEFFADLLFFRTNVMEPEEKQAEFLKWLFDFEYNKIGIPEPTMVVFLDMPVEVSQKLMTSRYNGDESKKDVHECNVEFLHKCRESALYACKKYGWKVISCAENGELLSIETINDKIYEAIKPILK